MRSIEQCYFQLPLLTSQGYDILQRQITRKWYKTHMYLMRQNSRKSYEILSYLSNGAIFSDLE